MSILVLLLLIALIGLFAWLLIRFVPMPPAIHTVLIVAAVVICVLILLQAIGLLPLSLNQSVPRVR